MQLVRAVMTAITAASVLRVTACCDWGLIVTGTAESLVAAGIVRHEWLPGYPGNNKTSLTVILDEATPRLTTGTRSCHGSGTLNLSRRNSREFDVRVPWSEADESRQREFFADLRRQRPLPAPFHPGDAGVIAWAEIFAAAARTGVPARVVDRR